MGATTPINGTIPSDIATSLSAPTVGTQVNAEDVQTGEQTLMNNWAMARNGNPTWHGCWIFARDSGTPPASNTPSITALGISVTGIVVSGTGMAALTAKGGSTTGSNTAGAGAIINGGDATVGGFGGVGALVSAGADSNGYGVRGQGNGVGSGVEGQGGIDGNGGTFTGGTTSGHGAVGITTDTGSAGVKGQAASPSSVAVWASGGGIFVDTLTPGTSPGANMVYKDKIVAAEGAIATTSTPLGGSIPGSFVNCIVHVDGTDATLLNVSFRTNMAGVQYVISYGMAEYSTATNVLIPLTVPGSKANSGFSVRVRGPSGTPINWTTDPGTIAFDFTVVGAQ